MKFETGVGAIILAVIVLAVLYGVFRYAANKNTPIDTGVLVLIIAGIVLLRGVLGTAITQEPMEDKISEILNNGVSEEYYFNIKSDTINEAYQNFIFYEWEEFYMLNDLPGSEKSDNMVVTKDYAFVDYGTFSKHRTRIFQNRTGDDITDAALMDLCQDYEESVIRGTVYSSQTGKNLKAEIRDFYNKETREPTKTVTSIWWKENGYSFFIESDYSLEELEPYIEEMTIIVVNRDK